jgi:phosphoribosylanthranilate isomerase
MMGVRIKLCGVRRPEDAQLCEEAGADEIGVIFASHSRRCVSLEIARQIRAVVPPEVVLVGVFQDATLEDAVRVADAVGLTALQFHGKLPSHRHARLRMYAALQMDGPAALDRLANASGFHRVLLDGPAGGSGTSFAWSLARDARGRFAGELFVGGGLTSENVAEAIRAAAPDGVDVASGIEGPDGFKDPERVRAFVAAVRQADGGEPA